MTQSCCDTAVWVWYFPTFPENSLNWLQYTTNRSKSVPVLPQPMGNTGVFRQTKSEVKLFITKSNTCCISLLLRSPSLNKDTAVVWSPAEQACLSPGPNVLFACQLTSLSVISSIGTLSDSSWTSSSQLKEDQEMKAERKEGEEWRWSSQNGNEENWSRDKEKLK